VTLLSMRNFLSKVEEVFFDRLMDVVGDDERENIEYQVALSHHPHVVIVPTMATVAGATVEPEDEEVMMLVSTIILSLYWVVDEPDGAHTRISANAWMSLDDYKPTNIIDVVDGLWAQLSVQRMDYAINLADHLTSGDPQLPERPSEGPQNPATSPDEAP